MEQAAGGGTRRARRARRGRGGLRALAALAALVVLTATGGAGTGPVQAAELVMFESPACHWCARWHDEIWPIYPKTAEARRAPLRRVNLHDPWPADLRHIRAVSFTPTFVLMADGAEVGRITGYAGEDFFWFQLSAVVQKLPEEATPEAPASNAAAGSPGGG